MFSFLRRRDCRRRPDGSEALLRMTPRELADLPFWAEPPPDCADGACAEDQPPLIRRATTAISCTTWWLARPQSRRSSVSGT